MPDGVQAPRQTTDISPEMGGGVVHRQLLNWDLFQFVYTEYIM